MNDFADFVRSLQPYAVAISFAAVYLGEHIIPQRRELIDHKHDLKNLLVGLVNLGIAGVGGFYLQKWLEFTNGQHFGMLHVFAGLSWLKIALGFLLIDIIMYWWHRVNHRYLFLWQFHRFHHRDEKMNSTTATRFHAVELLLSYVLRFSLFPLLGLDITAVFLHGLVLFPIIVFHHSNLRISELWDIRLRFLFVTPRMHRIHHSKIRQETDSNYGSVFPYWDAIFGSYVHKPQKEIEFGV